MANKNIIKRIISNQLVQTFLIYVSGGWIALEITDYLISNYGLNNRIRDVVSILGSRSLYRVSFGRLYAQRKHDRRGRT